MQQHLRERCKSGQRTGTGMYSAVAVSCSVAVLMITGCDAPSPTEHIETSPEALFRQSQTATPPSLDSWFASVAEQVPGFGGAFYGDDGALNVYLQDTLQEAAARTALSSLLERSTTVGVHGLPPSGEMNVLKGTFDFADLNEWRERLRPEVLGISGVVSLDIDETRNRLVVGTVDGTGGATAQTLERLGIPPEAVITERQQPAVFAATLRDRVRPVHGGLKIAYSSYLCTLGFNAYQNNRRSYLTASHCTDIQAVVESTEHYQSTVSGGNFIGTEYKDPAFFEGGICPQGRVCRYSDAAMGEYTDSTTSHDGRIARTTFRNPSSGSITIDSGNPFFFVRSERPYPINNEELNKVGQNTGWTYGNVTHTCSDEPVLGTNITLLCQYRVSGGVGGGDSGSPVFSYSGKDATLFGILWGSAGSTVFVFSSMEKVEWELGSLETTTTYDPVEVRIEGYRTIKRAGDYTWTANASGGNGSYTYLWKYRRDGGSWQTIGTGSSVQRYVSSADYPGFDLRVTAYSDGLQDMDEMYVPVLILF